MSKCATISTSRKLTLIVHDTRTVSYSAWGRKARREGGGLYSHARGASLIRRNVLECSAVRDTRSAELPFGSFLVTQCSAPRERGCYFFIACPVRRAARACDKKAECFGMLRGTRYARSAELPWAPFWRLNAAHLVNEAVIFLSRALCGEPRGRAIKKTPPLIAGVRCIGRSYRNRTYTMGVRGPCATTTRL